MEKIISPISYQWFAVYIKSRAEKKAQKELIQKNIETFLPLQRKLRQWSDRKKWIELPLIPGYLFVRVSRIEYDAVLQSNNVVGYVRFEGAAARIPDEQINYLRLMLKQDNHDIEVTRDNLDADQTIEVIAGPFIGMQGKLIRIKGKSKIAIELRELGYSTLIEISPDDICVLNQAQ